MPPPNIPDRAKNELSLRTRFLLRALAPHLVLVPLAFAAALSDWCFPSLLAAFGACWWVSDMLLTRREQERDQIARPGFWADVGRFVDGSWRAFWRWW